MRIKESYRRSLEANIDYHSTLAEVSEKAGEAVASKRHSLFVNVYKALIESK